MTSNIDDKFRNLTLPEVLAVIIPDDVRLPKSQKFARALYFQIIAKFQSCTKKEKRNITRSDPEFMLILMETIMKRCGFKNEMDAYGETIKIPEIPIIKRKNELLWHPVADPEENPQPPDEELDFVIGMLSDLNKLVMKATKEYYPYEYSRTYATIRHGILNVNTSQVELINQLKGARTDPFEFFKIAIPILTEATTSYIADNCSLKPKEVKEMHETIVQVLNDIMATVEKKKNDQ